MTTPPTTYLEMMMQSKAHWKQCMESLKQLIVPNRVFASMEQSNNQIKQLKTASTPPEQIPMDSAWYNPDSGDFYVFDGKSWIQTNENTVIEASKKIISDRQAELDYDRAMKGI